MHRISNHGWPLNSHSNYRTSFYGINIMNKLVVLESGLTPVTVEPEHDGIRTGSAIDTARAAAEYASQLSHEYHSLLHRHLFMANPKIAGRFHSLITELTTITDLTLENVRFGRK